MVIFGGLELVAAGYLIHQHNKNKKERRQLQEEAEILEEEEYHRRSHSHSDRRRRRSYDDLEDDRYSRDNRPRRDHAGPSQSQSQRPADEKPQYLNPGYYAPPPRPSSAPPQDPNYPPTGWPENWKQSQNPDPNAPPNYAHASAAAYSPYQVPPYQGPPNGPSRDTRHPARPSSPRVHFEEPPASQASSSRHSHRHSRRGEGSDRRTSGYSDPPPEYRE